MDQPPTSVYHTDVTENWFDQLNSKQEEEFQPLTSMCAGPSRVGLTLTL